MNSREIVRRTLEFDNPERIPGTFPAPYWNDLVFVSYALEGFNPVWENVGGAREEYVDEWGNTWARIDPSSKGEVAKGVLESWEDLDTLNLPDLGNPANFDCVREFCANPDETRYRVGNLPGFPFNVARKMRRLDSFLMDILLERERVLDLLGRIEDLLAETIVQYAKTGVDAVMFPEDWGTQLALMVSPAIWREVFKPGFTRLCAVAHEHGIKVFMHSCGKITVIIPDLIESGIDLLQFDQPQLHGLDALAQFHGQITFWCPVDIQKTLQTQDPKQITAEAHAMVDKMGQGGGFIGGYYSDNMSIGLDPEIQAIACRAFMEHGVFAQ